MITSKLDVFSYEQQSLKIHRDSQHNSISANQRAQAESAYEQKCLSIVQTKRIQEHMRNYTQELVRDQQTTRDLILTSIGELQALRSELPLGSMRNGGRIVYFGKQQQSMMAFILTLKDDFDNAVLSLFNSVDPGVSLSHLALLQYTFKDLVGSAAQEQASSYAGSTASSFDEWIILESVGHPGSSLIPIPDAVVSHLAVD